MATDAQRAWIAAHDRLRGPAGHVPPQLTPRQRDEVHRRLADGERPVDLAAEYGVRVSLIRKCR